MIVYGTAYDVKVIIMCSDFSNINLMCARIKVLCIE